FRVRDNWRPQSVTWQPGRQALPTLLYRRLPNAQSAPATARTGRKLTRILTVKNYCLRDRLAFEEVERGRPMIGEARSQADGRMTMDAPEPKALRLARYLK